jgi:hypothetical protein
MHLARLAGPSASHSTSGLANSLGKERSQTNWQAIGYAEMGEMAGLGSHTERPGPDRLVLRVGSISGAAVLDERSPQRLSVRRDGNQDHHAIWQQVLVGGRRHRVEVVFLRPDHRLAGLLELGSEQREVL